MKTILATIAWILSAGLNYWGALELKTLQDEIKALHSLVHDNLEVGE